MYVQQAIYGSKHGGHALLASSDESLTATFRAAAWAADLPSTVPTGVIWKPYFRTVCIDNYFVLVYTRPDDTASRAGMVVSRAAFIPIDKLQYLTDLRLLAGILREPPTDEKLQPLKIDESPAAIESARQCGIVRSIASGVVRAETLPIVHVGQQDFDEAMLELWTQAPAELRKYLLFSLSFGPDDTIDRNLVAVCTPHELKTRWTGYRFVDTTDVGPLSTAAAALLDVESGQDLRQFAGKMGMALGSIQDLNTLQHAYELWNDASTTAEIMSFVRLLAAKSSSIDIAVTLKGEALMRLTSSATPWTTSDVLSMRNLNLAGFATMDKVWRELVSWSEKMEIHARHSIADVSKLLSDAVCGNAVPSWSEAVLTGVRRAFISEQVNEKLCMALWQSILRSTEYIKDLLELVASTNSFQKFWQVVPNEIEEHKGMAIAHISSEHGWWEIAGVALAVSSNPISSARKILGLNPQKSKRRALVAALSKAMPEEVVGAALELDDKDIIELAGQVCGRNCELLAGFEWKSAIWFDVLMEALKVTPSALNSIPELPNKINSLLTAEEMPDSLRIWSAIAKTELGDLSAIPNRAMVWEKIPDGPRVLIIARTVEGWIKKFEAETVFMPAPELPLANAVQARIKEPAFMCEVAMRSPATFVRYLAVVFQGTDYEVKELIYEVGIRLEQNHFDFNSARELGSLIREKGWRHTASVVGNFVNTRRDFIPVIQECQSLLNVFERLGLALKLGFPTSLTDDEAWDALETEAVGLYPSGPAHNEVWSRSGGKNEELPSEFTGRAQWHRCLKEIRAGRRPSTRQLVQTMLQDFPYNQTLRHLERHEF